MLTVGTRLGPYEIVAAIGAGGMGEVYRATDTNLGRQVAIKVLPEAFATDPERLARFEREAKTLAALNHPHIAQIYGLERSGGTQALVMELVEGETLAERIARGPIPLDEALPIAKQIAEALEAAHEQGIIHRDLKPANIKVRPDGTVRVLDFGLAKLTESSGSSTSDLSLSPTITSPAMMTGVGVLLGTAAYMAPEQARGKPADKRSDIWAFGAVLYEMVTGRPAFGDEDVSLTLSKVLQRDPEWLALRPDVPPRVRQVLRLCLQKDPKQRAQAIGDVRLALEGAFETVAPQAMATPPASRSRLIAWGAVIGVAVTAVAASLLWILWHPASQTPRPVARFTVELPASAEEVFNSGIAVARDGRTFLYGALGDDGIPRLYARPLAQLESTPIRGSENAESAALSPDGAWVAFVAEGQLKKVALTGGPPVVLCDVPEGVFGTDWSIQDAIIFGSPQGVSRVPAAGGMPEVIVKLDPGAKEASYRWPHALADGRTILFTIWFGASATAQVAISSLDSGERRTLAQGAYPRMTPNGQLLFTRVRSLWAVQLDASRLAIVGEPVPVLENVQTQTSGLSLFDIAADGTFAYRQAGIAGGLQRLVWFGRDEQTTLAVTEQLTGIYHPPPRLSPDGRRLAVTIHPEGGGDQVVLYDLERGIRTPIGTGPRMDSRWPVWTPDGARITFASTSAGTYDLYSVPAAGGAPEPLLVGKEDQEPLSWSPDGRVLAFSQTGRGGGSDIWMLPRGGEPSPFVTTPFNERNAAFSPNGRWLAYDSNESGRFEVYVQPYPGPGEKVRVSTSGGAEPVWARDGTALFYREGQRDLMAVSIGSGPTLRVGAPRSLVQIRLWSGDLGQYYDVSPDGRRFIGIENPNASLPSLIVVQNWSEELNRLVPAN